MGSARRIAEGLMEHFLLTEEEAYAKVKYVEAVDLGDEIHDMLTLLVDEGDLDECLQGLIDLIHQLANARIDLMAAFSGVKKRRTTDA